MFIRMKCRRSFLLLMVLVLICAVGAGAQNRPGSAASPVELQEASAAQNEPPQTSAAVFPLFPVLEAAFSGELFWRPDWPESFPPDAFSPAGGGYRKAFANPALAITLSNGIDSFSFLRDSANHLREFPFFLQSGAAKVEALWTDTGALRELKISAASPDSETLWNFTFPPDFFSLNDISRNGAFSPVNVSSNGANFFVVLHESGELFTETWYDEQGNLSVFFGFLLLQKKGESYRVGGMQKLDAAGSQSTDYYFDSEGNITEIRFPDAVFQALYRDRRPRYWKLQPEKELPVSRLALQWDARWLLVNIRTLDESAGANSGEGSLSMNAPPKEYRYEYELDSGGNWTKRQDIEMINQFGLLIPRAGKTWLRVISPLEE
jgi:hypothetical protein